MSAGAPNEALASRRLASIRVSDSGRACVYIEHNLAHVHEVADRLVVLERGTVVAEIKPEDMTVTELTDFLITLQHQADG